MWSFDLTGSNAGSVTQSPVHRRAMLPAAAWSCFAIFTLIACRPDGPTKALPHTTWQDYGGSPDQSKYFVQDRITKQNVSSLQPVWQYDPQDGLGYQMNPIVVDTMMYVFGRHHSLIALDARTGRELWIHADLRGISRRGLTFWQSEDGSDRRLLFTLDNTLQAIDARTGQSILHFGDHGLVDLRQGLDRDPEKIMRIAPGTPGKVFEDLIILGSSPGESYLSSPGHIRAYDVLTGEMRWIFKTIPGPGAYGYGTWPKEAHRYAGGANCWGEMTVDVEHGLVFVPLGSPTYDYYGADRIGDNLFGNCLVALDARSGERKWHFQTVHHDLWDYDLAAAPQLIEVVHEGRPKQVVALATKQGFLFAFERQTGEPLWPIEEKSVPRSDVPDEVASLSQPIPSKPPPFTRQNVRSADVSPIFLSESDYTNWQERIDRAATGLYTPPSTRETIAMPGAVGGANFGNTASNPTTGMVYVMSQDYPSVYQLKPSAPVFATPAPPAVSPASLAAGEQAYKAHCQSCHGADLAGSAVGPALHSMAARLDMNYLRRTVKQGIGRMPAIPHISDDEISNILGLLHARSTGETIDLPTEVGVTDPRIVASGGAPGRDAVRSAGTYNRAGDDYPEAIDVPTQRYYTGYGLGYPYLLHPPWSSLTAYDLNAGVIKWRIPLGEDRKAAAQGLQGTGVPTGSQRNGMIVTSNGLIFATVANGMVYAYDAADGSTLWSHQVSTGIAAMPSMYTIGEEIFLVINATTPFDDDWGAEDDGPGERAQAPGAYVVFSLSD